MKKNLLRVKKKLKLKGKNLTLDVPLDGAHFVCQEIITNSLGDRFLMIFWGCIDPKLVNFSTSGFDFEPEVGCFSRTECSNHRLSSGFLKTILFPV